MLGQHQAVDFQEERILRHLLLKGRYLARGISHLTGIMQKEKKNASKSQGHTWLAFAVTKLGPLASEDSSGCWQRTALAEPEPAGVGASCAKVLCLLAPLPAQS